MSRLSTQFHDSLVRAIHEIRERLGVANVPSFTFSVSTSGRTMTEKAEIKIEYNLGVERYDGANVKGNDLDRCIGELLRRNGWDETNRPLSLPAPKKAGGTQTV